MRDNHNGTGTKMSKMLKNKVILIITRKDLGWNFELLVIYLMGKNIYKKF